MIRCAVTSAVCVCVCHSVLCVCVYVNDAMCGAGLIGVFVLLTDNGRVYSIEVLKQRIGVQN